MPIGTFTAVLHKEGELYVADCPEIGTVSQGKTVEDSIANLKEATELYLEEFPPRRFQSPARHRLRGTLCLDCPVYQGQKQFALSNDLASLRFGSAGVTLCLSALDEIESLVVLFLCIQNLQSARCAES